MQLGARWALPTGPAPFCAAGPGLETDVGGSLRSGPGLWRTPSVCVSFPTAAALPRGTVPGPTPQFPGRGTASVGLSGAQCPRGQRRGGRSPRSWVGCRPREPTVKASFPVFQADPLPPAWPCRLASSHPGKCLHPARRGGPSALSGTGPGEHIPERPGSGAPAAPQPPLSVSSRLAFCRRHGLPSAT